MNLPTHYEGREWHNQSEWGLRDTGSFFRLNQKMVYRFVAAFLSSKLMNLLLEPNCKEHKEFLPSCHEEPSEIHQTLNIPLWLHKSDQTISIHICIVKISYPWKMSFHSNFQFPSWFATENMQLKVIFLSTIWNPKM